MDALDAFLNEGAPSQQAGPAPSPMGEASAPAPSTQPADPLDAFLMEGMPAAQPEPSEPWEISKGFQFGLQSLGSMSGGAIAAIGDTLKDIAPKFSESGLGTQTGADIQQYGIDLFNEFRKSAAQYQGQNVTLESVYDSPETFDAFTNWLFFNVGQGAATSVPALLAFLVNPTLGAGVVYGMGVGETYGQMLEDGKDPAAEYAIAAGVPYAMSERLFGAGARVAGMIKKGGGPRTSRSFLKRLAKEVPTTMASEATAEGAQNVIVEGAAELARVQLQRGAQRLV